MRYTLNGQIKVWFRHEIWGYRRCAVENASVQRSDTVNGGEFTDVSKDCTAFIFKMNSPRLITFLRPFLTEIKPVRPIFKGWRHIEYPKTSVRNGHYLLRNTTDQRSSQVILASCSLSMYVQHISTVLKLSLLPVACLCMFSTLTTLVTLHSSVTRSELLRILGR
jgi:hypothetical protein